jgi:hypothetical protein
MTTIDSEEKKNNEKESTKNNTDSKSQSINFGGMIQDFLSAANADVEKSKFSIEKTADGTRIDFAFTALIKSKKKASLTEVTS